MSKIHRHTRTHTSKLTAINITRPTSFQTSSYELCNQVYKTAGFLLVSAFYRSVCVCACVRLSKSFNLTYIQTITILFDIILSERFIFVLDIHSIVLFVFNCFSNCALILTIIVADLLPNLCYSFHVDQSFMIYNL